MCVAITADGRRVATGGDTLAVVWDAATGEELMTFNT
jgi:hypothetical protein